VADFDLGHLRAEGLVLRPEETAEERAHRLREAAKNAAFNRGLLCAAGALAVVSAMAAMFGPVETRSFAANTWWTLVGAGVGYALSKR
jgi:uncharacterized protein YaaW (UPF0174 family)